MNRPLGIKNLSRTTLFDDKEWPKYWLMLEIYSRTILFIHPSYTYYDLVRPGKYIK